MKIQFIFITLLLISSSAWGGASAPVYHKHGATGHKHALPAQGKNHNHGGKRQIAKPQTRAHFHGKTQHYHTLPKGKGIRHQHGKGDIGSYGARNTSKTQKTKIQVHFHGAHQHKHKLPGQGIRHRHKGGDIGRSAPTPSGKRVSKLHNHGKARHSHILPTSGLNHSHNGQRNASKNNNRNNPSKLYTPAPQPEKKWCPERKSICLATTWGPDVCGKLIDEELAKQGKDKSYDTFTSPACLAAISEATGESYSSSDLNIATFTGALDDVGKRSIESGGLVGKLVGGYLGLISLGTKGALYDSCMRKCD